MNDIIEETICLAGKGSLDELNTFLNTTYDAKNVAISALIYALKSTNRKTKEAKVLIGLSVIQENASYLGNTFLRMARYIECDEIMQLLLANPSVALHDAGESNNIAKVKTLIEAGQCAYKFRNQLYLAAKDRGHSDITEYLRQTPEVDLMASADEGNTSRVETLLSRGINPTVERNYALDSAAMNGHSKLVLLLIKTPAIRNSNVAELSDIMSRAAHSGNIKEAMLIFTIPNVRAHARIDPDLTVLYSKALSNMQKTTDFVSQILGAKWLLDKHNEPKLNGDVLVYILKHNFPEFSEKELSNYLDMEPSRLLNHYLLEDRKRHREDSSKADRQVRQKVKA